MGKKKLLKRVADLEGMEEEQVSLNAALHDDLNALKQENATLKKDICRLQDKIKEMSDTENLYNELSKYREARTHIAINHNNVLEALHRVKTQHQKMMSEFDPWVAKFTEHVHILADEFLIPIDMATNKEFLSGEERVKEYEARNVKE